MKSLKASRDELLKSAILKLGDGSIAGSCLTIEILPCLSPLILKSSWIISVELAIGPEEGISYLTDKGANVSLLLVSFLSYSLNNHDLL